MSKRGKVRSASYRDLRAISRLASQSARTDYGFYPPKVQNIIRRRNGWWRLFQTMLRQQRSLFVAEVDGLVVGYMIATPNNDDVALIYSLYVDPGQRSRAFGRRLLELFESDYVRPPVNKIMLWTELASGYYAKIGWREAAVLPEHWWGQTFHIYVKDVTSQGENGKIMAEKNGDKSSNVS